VKPRIATVQVMEKVSFTLTKKKAVDVQTYVCVATSF